MHHSNPRAKQVRRCSTIILMGVVLLTILTGGCEKTQIAVIRDDARFQSDVLQSSPPVLVDFYKVNCKNCAALEPIMQKLADEYEGRVTVLKFEMMSANSVVTAPELKKKYDIAFYPTVVLFVEGKEVHRWILDYDTDRYRRQLDQYALPAPAETARQ